MATECRDKLKKLLESGHESETRDQLMVLALDKRSCFEALMYFFPVDTVRIAVINSSGALLFVR